jgi:orotate phosphoribosyltransferase
MEHICGPTTDCASSWILGNLVPKFGTRIWNHGTDAPLFVDWTHFYTPMDVVAY